MANMRAEQVGSLLRPPELLKARADFAEGKVDREYVRYEEDRAILEILAVQRQSGIDVLTDGEYRRGAWMTDMADSVDGFVKQSAVMHWKGPDGGDEPSSSHVVGGKLKAKRALTGDQAEFVSKHAGSQPFKVTIPSPSGFMISSYKRGVSDSAYATPQDMLRDLSGIVREEVGRLMDQGVPYVQLDTPQYSYYGDPAMTAPMRDAGLNPDEGLATAIAADNAAIEGAHGATLALHICRGNSRSRWVAEGGYDAFAEQLFTGLNVDRFLLEYDDPARSGSFEPLRFVPPNKMVVLGLITTKTPALEDTHAVKRRIDEAARHIPLERLAVSPQCGFASVATGNLLDWDDQRRKLELVVEVARDVWA